MSSSIPELDTLIANSLKVFQANADEMVFWYEDLDSDGVAESNEVAWLSYDAVGQQLTIEQPNPTVSGVPVSSTTNFAFTKWGFDFIGELNTTYVANGVTSLLFIADSADVDSITTVQYTVTMGGVDYINVIPIGKGVVDEHPVVSPESPLIVNGRGNIVHENPVNAGGSAWTSNFRHTARIFSRTYPPHALHADQVGYLEGDVWFDVDSTQLYLCVESAGSFAVWRKLVVGDENGDIKGGVVVRQGTQAELAGVLLDSAELAFANDAQRLYVGDGQQTCAELTPISVRDGWLVDSFSTVPDPYGIDDGQNVHFVFTGGPDPASFSLDAPRFDGQRLKLVNAGAGNLTITAGAESPEVWRSSAGTQVTPFTGVLSPNMTTALEGYLVGGTARWIIVENEGVWT
ncbi:MAG: hypothetical protein AAGD32_13780 [Planctomycetota bacterium]